MNCFSSCSQANAAKHSSRHDKGMHMLHT
jgi:hypothetical protein